MKKNLWKHGHADRWQAFLFIIVLVYHTKNLPTFQEAHFYGELEPMGTEFVCI